VNQPGLAEKSAFFGGATGALLINGTAGFILLYLTDEIGISAAAVGTMLLVTRIVDGALDPMLGYAVDHMPPTRWGRFRPYAVLGTLLSAVGLIGLFTLPSLTDSPLLVAWVVYLVWGLFLGMMTIPLVSLMPTISADAKVRGQLAAIVGVTGLLMAAVASAATLPLVRAFGGGTRGWALYATLIAGISVLLAGLMGLKVRERVAPLVHSPYRLADVRRVFFSDRAVPILLVCKVTVSTAGGALGAAAPFFFRYYMGDENLLSVAVLVMAVPMLIGAAIMPTLARRSGLKFWYLVGLACSIVGFGGIYFVPAAMGPILVCLALAGFGTGGVSTLNLVLLAELTDFVEWRQGHRAEASLAALTSFATKAGAGLGAGLVAFMLSLHGFDGGAATQTAEAIRGVLLAQSMVPAMIGVLGTLAFLAYPITRELAAEATRVLAESRDTALAESRAQALETR
jgi:sugar (glycoside-pentoside-hexuronide) transporter